jgi:Zn-dependent protease
LFQLTPDSIAMGLTYYVVLLFSLSFHEASHAWMASRMGDDTARSQGRVSLNPILHIDLVGTVLMPLLQFLGPAHVPLLGWAKPTPVEARNFRSGELARGQVLVAGAGPASNLLLAIIFTSLLFVAVKTAFVTRSEDVAFLILAIGVQMNVALAIFNMIPLPPLDGSWVASWGLPRPIAERYDRMVEPFSQYLLLVLFVPLGWVLSPVIDRVTRFFFSLAYLK